MREYVLPHGAVHLAANGRSHPQRKHYEWTMRRTWFWPRSGGRDGPFTAREELGTNLVPVVTADVGNRRETVERSFPKLGCRSPAAFFWVCDTFIGMSRKWTLSGIVHPLAVLPTRQTCLFSTTQPINDNVKCFETRLSAVRSSVPGGPLVRPGLVPRRPR